MPALSLKEDAVSNLAKQEQRRDYHHKWGGKKSKRRAIKKHMAKKGGPTCPKCDSDKCKTTLVFMQSPSKKVGGRLRPVKACQRKKLGLD